MYCAANTSTCVYLFTSLIHTNCNWIFHFLIPIWFDSLMSWYYMAIVRLTTVALSTCSYGSDIKGINTQAKQRHTHALQTGLDSYCSLLKYSTTAETLPRKKENEIKWETLDACTMSTEESSEDHFKFWKRSSRYLKSAEMRKSWSHNSKKFITWNHDGLQFPCTFTQLV